MDVEKLLEIAKALEKKRKTSEELDQFKKVFERFHLLNRSYLDKETYESAQGTIFSMAEAMANTLRYLDAEIARLRNKRMKLPVENVELAEMQKVQQRNEILVKEVLAEHSR